MKEAKIVFRGQPNHVQAAEHIAEELQIIEHEILMELGALIDRPECHRCEQFLAANITLDLNTYAQPKEHELDLNHFRREAQRLLDKHHDVLQNQGLMTINHILNILSRCETKERKDGYMRELKGTLDYLRDVPRALKEDLDNFIDKYIFMEFNLLGQYDDRTKTITIYMQNHHHFDDMKSTFAHELFHAYHYYLLRHVSVRLGLARRTRNKRLDTTVKESLASYYEAYYDRWHNLHHQEAEIVDRWNRYQPDIYPYSGAKFIRDQHHFKAIVDVSLQSFEDAYHMLGF